MVVRDPVFTFEPAPAPVLRPGIPPVPETKRTATATVSHLFRLKGSRSSFVACKASSRLSIACQVIGTTTTTALISIDLIL